MGRYIVSRSLVVSFAGNTYTFRKASFGETGFDHPNSYECVSR